MPLPYENATSGKAAVNEMCKITRAFGASSFGVMEDFANGVLLVQFSWRDRSVSIKASAKGYAQAWLKHHPYGSRTRGTQIDYERRALKIGQTAVYSILRDWIKGQFTAVETGMLSFEGAFLGQIMLANGETVLERLQQTDMLSLPKTEAAA
jgi:hypothetical protein